ncbi:protein RTE1-HOMOLOG [Oryza sativa Japonica Group]|nr:protein RTE1-HOMOLOG [Oryza sativa Japonica Group]XP_052146793.1 protein RTE1-HOMOLOG [Oryza glaberrima]EAY92201.1 hypothetical protein OsI_13920 [Oryza sativa Indica Group]KAB8094013.1 hypothetical protein EE612_021046 [Oryza sativa]AAO37528.1 hypothetical protein [Oryza sativa Japonica Group]ABF99374.1 expressed protein [Oryza sativa Japonica Group]KAF2941839.1 hypothetical protein DAI22_03g376600 [Oryza sativa Japonica Group]|eukprot:NP_001051577.1 Os03g0799500 [Oryza sativa Japonica Group]
METDRSQPAPIDPRRARFPCCIVWTPLPLISWLIPFIGHIGICREDGVILDFAGPNFVSVDNFAFGAVARYIQVNSDECYKLLEPEGASTWDDALRKGVQEFQHRGYSLFTCNCHSFVVNNLNRLFYSGHDKWNVVSLAAVMFLRGRWVSTASVVKTFFPFALVITIGTLLGGATFLIGLLAFAAVMTGWFLVGTYCIKSLVEL